MLSVSDAKGKGGHDFAGDGKFLKGVVQSVSGEVLSYWNFHPFAKQSLLTRCTTGEMAISWKTEPLPPFGTADTLSFLWIGAFATGTSTADHEFDFFVNGEPSLTFRTFKGGKYDDWSVPGQKGVRLSYKHVWTDHVNDAHGYFFLRVPATSFAAGQPLTLSVVGRRADSRDWYMTFIYAVKESAVVRPLPVTVREEGAARQPIEISIDSPSDQGSVAIGLDGSPPKTYPLRLGWNAVQLSIPAVEVDRRVPITISINGGATESRTATVKPVNHRTIWLLPHSHNDIGYSDVQTTVLNIQIQNLRDAMQLIEKSKNHPEGSRYKWNVEILWPIDSFLIKASADEREHFIDAVKKGDIGLNTLYVNPLTGIARPEALIRLTDFSRELQRSYGLQLRTAMVSDIPGFSWGIVTALAHGGIRYFVSGPNSGDRIGHFVKSWGDKPFYWVGPSRKDSVLFWVAGTGYSLFHATRTFATNTSFNQKLQEYLESLDATHYPYDIVQMRYSVYSDNGMTDSTMSDFVRDWNTTHISPTLHIGTAEEMCIAFENQYGSQIPSYAGDITPYWEDGAASSAAELGAANRAVERLVQTEVLTSMSSPRTFDRGAFADAWDAVNLWVEHTWGAWNSVSDPDNPWVVAQWNIKKEFGVEIEKRGKELLHRQTRTQTSSDSPVVEVINTSSWPRTDLVFLSAEESLLGERILDERRRPVPSQRLSDGRLAFVAHSVPSLGTSRFTLTAGRSTQARGVTVNRWTVENEFLRISVDSVTGAVRSIRARSSGRELVGVSSSEGINSFVNVAGTDSKHRSEVRLVRLSIGEKGPLIGSIISEVSSAGVNSVSREVSLKFGFDEVQFLDVIDKQAAREKEALYFGFALNVPNAVTRFDLGLGYARAELDQLPGANRDYFSVQRWVDVSNANAGITMATVEAPLVSIGELVDERHHNEGPTGWKTQTASSSLIYSWVMNNYWHTNYKADQDGRSSYQYSIRPHAAFDGVQAYRFGVQKNQPLIVRRIQPKAPRPRLPFVFRSSSLAITTITPAPTDRALLVRLYNPSPKKSFCEFVPAGGLTLGVFESSPAGERGKKLLRRIEMDPFELRTVRVE